MTEATRRIHKFDFSGDNHAVSLVSKNVGGAANQYQTLIMKGADVVVELSMAEFLNRFFDVWSYDAEVLSEMLGYSSDFDLWDEDKMAEKITLLKSLKENDKDEKALLGVLPIIKSVAAKNGVKISDLAEIEKANGEDPVSDNNVESVEKASETSPKEEVIMTAEMIEKSVHETELAKALKAKEDEVEIRKGLELQLADFLKAKEEAEKAEFIEKAKGLDVAGVEGEAVEAVAVAMQKASAQEDTKVLVDTILKMATLLKSAGTLEEVEGHSSTAASEDHSEVSGTMAFIKSKKQSK